MTFSATSIREFHYKEAHFHILTEAWEPVCEKIIAERLNLEAFIRDYPDFQTSLVPLALGPSLSLRGEAVRRMHRASVKTGLGPMAAVAGTMAQLAAETSRNAGSPQTLVENGGDLYMDCREDMILALYLGDNPHFRNLALKIQVSRMPLAVCSSSSRMGHSLSFGDCDLVTVFSKDGALADAGATMACNQVRREEDIERVLEKLMGIKGIRGALIVRDDRLGVIGEVPELIKTETPDWKSKLSKDKRSGWDFKPQ